MKAVRFLVFASAVLLMGCQKDNITIKESPLDSGVDFRSAEKLLVCHGTDPGTKSWELIEVTEISYLKAHKEHGDAQPGEAIPGMPGYKFGCNCDVEMATINTVDMLDGRTWTSNNLEIVPCGYDDQTWWYDDVDSGYGLLYSWKAADEACKVVGAVLGEKWGLPTNEEWNALIAAYDGNDNPNDNNLNAYYKLLQGGDSGFDALLGGFWDWEYSRYSLGGSYGYYWSGTEHQTSPELYAHHVFLASPVPSYIQVAYFTSKNYGMSCRCIKKLPG